MTRAFANERFSLIFLRDANLFSMAIGRSEKSDGVSSNRRPFNGTGFVSIEAKIGGGGELPPVPKGLDDPEISRQLTQTMCGVDILYKY